MRSLGFYLYNKITGILPETRLFSFKRFWLRNFCFCQIGKNVRICSSVKIQVQGKLEIGDNTWIGEFTKITGGKANIIIGSNVDIGPEVLIVSGTHSLWTIEGKAAGEGYSREINIEDGVWIGARAVILGGARIGYCAIIGATSLVKGVVDSNTLFAGIPAKLVKRK